MRVKWWPTERARVACDEGLSVSATALLEMDNHFHRSVGLGEKSNDDQIRYNCGSSDSQLFQQDLLSEDLSQGLLQSLPSSRLSEENSHLKGNISQCSTPSKECEQNEFSRTDSLCGSDKQTSWEEQNLEDYSSSTCTQDQRASSQSTVYGVQDASSETTVGAGKNDSGSQNPRQHSLSSSQATENPISSAFIRDGLNGQERELIIRLKEELERECTMRAQTDQFNKDLQVEYEKVLKRLAECELHIDRLRLSSSDDHAVKNKTTFECEQLTSTPMDSIPEVFSPIHTTSHPYGHQRSIAQTEPGVQLARTWEIAAENVVTSPVFIEDSSCYLSSSSREHDSSVSRLKQIVTGATWGMSHVDESCVQSLRASGLPTRELKKTGCLPSSESDTPCDSTGGRRRVSRNNTAEMTDSQQPLVPPHPADDTSRKEVSKCRDNRRRKKDDVMEWIQTSSAVHSQLSSDPFSPDEGSSVHSTMTSQSIHTCSEASSKGQGRSQRKRTQLVLKTKESEATEIQAHTIRNSLMQSDIQHNSSTHIGHTLQEASTPLIGHKLQEAPHIGHTLQEASTPLIGHKLQEAPHIGHTLQEASTPHVGHTLQEASTPHIGHTLQEASTPHVGHTLQEASTPHIGRTLQEASTPHVGHTLQEASTPHVGHTLQEASTPHIRHTLQEASKLEASEQRSDEYSTIQVPSEAPRGRRPSRLCPPRVNYQFQPVKPQNTALDEEEMLSVSLDSLSSPPTSPVLKAEKPSRIPVRNCWLPYLKSQHSSFPSPVERDSGFVGSEGSFRGPVKGEQVEEESGVPLLQDDLSEDSSMRNQNEDSSMWNQNGDSSVRNQNGDSSVRSQNGDSSVRSQNGDSSVRNQIGDSSVRNQNGDSSVRSQNGDSSVRSQNGDSSVRSQNGDSSVRSQNGDSSVRSQNGDSSVRSQNGDSFVRSQNNSSTINESNVPLLENSLDVSQNQMYREAISALQHQLALAKDEIESLQLCKLHPHSPDGGTDGDIGLHGTAPEPAATDPHSDSSRKDGSPTVGSPTSANLEPYPITGDAIEHSTVTEVKVLHPAVCAPSEEGTTIPAVSVGTTVIAEAGVGLRQITHERSDPPAIGSTTHQLLLLSTVNSTPYSKTSETPYQSFVAANSGGLISSRLSSSPTPKPLVSTESSNPPPEAVGPDCRKKQHDSEHSRRTETHITGIPAGRVEGTGELTSCIRDEFHSSPVDPSSLNISDDQIPSDLESVGVSQLETPKSSSFDSSGSSTSSDDVSIIGPRQQVQTDSRQSSVQSTSPHEVGLKGPPSLQSSTNNTNDVPAVDTQPFHVSFQVHLGEEPVKSIAVQSELDGRALLETAIVQNIPATVPAITTPNSPPIHSVLDADPSTANFSDIPGCSKPVVSSNSHYQDASVNTPWREEPSPTSLLQKGFSSTQDEGAPTKDVSIQCNASDLGPHVYTHAENSEVFCNGTETCDDFLLDFGGRLNDQSSNLQKVEVDTGHSGELKRSSTKNYLGHLSLDSQSEEALWRDGVLPKSTSTPSKIKHKIPQSRSKSRSMKQTDCSVQQKDSFKQQRECSTCHSRPSASSGVACPTYRSACSTGSLDVSCSDAVCSASTHSSVCFVEEPFPATERSKFRQKRSANGQHGQETQEEEKFHHGDPYHDSCKTSHQHRLFDPIASNQHGQHSDRHITSHQYSQHSDSHTTSYQHGQHSDSHMNSHQHSEHSDGHVTSHQYGLHSGEIYQDGQHSDRHMTSHKQGRHSDKSTISHQPGRHSEKHTTSRRPGRHSEKHTTSHQPGQHSERHTTSHELGQHSEKQTTSRQHGRHSDKQTTSRQPGQHSDKQTTSHQHGRHSEKQTTSHQHSRHSEKQTTSHQHGRHSEKQTTSHKHGQHSEKLTTSRQHGQHSEKQTTSHQHGHSKKQTTSHQHGRYSDKQTTSHQHGRHSEKQTTSHKHGQHSEKLTTSRQHGQHSEKQTTSHQHGHSKKQTTSHQHGRYSDKQTTSHQHGQHSDKQTTSRQHGRHSEKQATSHKHGQHSKKLTTSRQHGQHSLSPSDQCQEQCRHSCLKPTPESPIHPQGHHEVPLPCASPSDDSDLPPHQRDPMCSNHLFPRCQDVQHQQVHHRTGYTSPPLRDGQQHPHHTTLHKHSSSNNLPSSLQHKPPRNNLLSPQNIDSQFPLERTKPSLPNDSEPSQPSLPKHHSKHHRKRWHSHNTDRDYGRTFHPLTSTRLDGVPLATDAWNPRVNIYAKQVFLSPSKFHTRANSMDFPRSASPYVSTSTLEESQLVEACYLAHKLKKDSKRMELFLKMDLSEPFLD